MYRVLVSDGLQEEAINELLMCGVEVVNKHYDKDEIGSKLKEFDALVIRSATKVTKDILKEVDNGKLKLIVRAGVGIDNIDVITANEKGITVKNTPNASSDSVAELALAHMLSIARFIGIANYTMRKNEWNKKKYKGVELSGKTLGIIGMGRIGRALGKKAEALGMNIIYYTIEGKHEDLKYEFLTLEEVLGKSDFISLHVPYDKENGALIGKKEFELMKDGIYIVNCSRGGVVDEVALLDALNSNKVSAIGIDVFDKEPTENQQLINHPKVSCTPHIGASTIEAQSKIGKEVVRVIKDFFQINK